MQKISNTEGGLATALGRQLETDGAFGESCAALGDYDGDGVPDAMVGAPQTGTSGVLYMLLLNKDGTVKKASTISADTGGFATATGTTGSIATRDNFAGRGIALLGDLIGDGKLEIAVGSRSADTEGAVWILSIDKSFHVVYKQKISSSTGVGGFPFPIAVGSGNEQMHSSGSELGNSLSAIGDVNNDGIPDLALSANNLGAGTLYILLLNKDGTVKDGSMYGKYNLASGTFGPLAAPPAMDRFCRSMSTHHKNDGSFSIICGAGASTTGDIWVLDFKKAGTAGGDNGDGDDVDCNGSVGSKTVFTAIVGFTFCKGGSTTFSSNWDHSTQLVAGPLTLDECKTACTKAGCAVMTVKDDDGRCILKTSDCTIGESSEQSNSYAVTTKGVCSDVGSETTTATVVTAPVTTDAPAVTESSSSSSTTMESTTAASWGSVGSSPSKATGGTSTKGLATATTVATHTATTTNTFSVSTSTAATGGAGEEAGAESTSPTAATGNNEAGDASSATPSNSGTGINSSASSASEGNARSHHTAVVTVVVVAVIMVVGIMVFTTYKHTAKKYASSMQNGNRAPVDTAQAYENPTYDTTVLSTDQNDEIDC
jgi:hypothetical protein